MTTLPAAKSSDLDNGKMLSVSISQTQVLLFRDTSGNLHAMRDRCSHAEVRLSDGTYDGEDEIECPAHGARFSVCSGKPLCMPAVASVQRFPCHESDGSIFVEIA